MLDVSVLIKPERRTGQAGSGGLDTSGTAPSRTSGSPSAERRSRTSSRTGGRARRSSTSTTVPVSANPSIRPWSICCVGRRPRLARDVDPAGTRSARAVHGPRRPWRVRVQRATTSVEAEPVGARLTPPREHARSSCRTSGSPCIRHTMWSNGSAAVGSPAGRDGSGSESGRRSASPDARASHGSQPAMAPTATTPPAARMMLRRVYLRSLVKFLGL